MKPVPIEVKRIALLALTLLLSLSSALTTAKDQPLEDLLAELPPPPADAAQIVFLKPARGLLGLPPTAIFEIKGNQRQLLDVMKSGRRLVVSVPPGEHLFMSHTKKRTYSEAPVHFLSSELEAGKRYFVLVRYLFIHGFQMRPIRPKGTSDYDMHNPEFSEWLAKGKSKPGPRRLVTTYKKRDAFVAAAQAAGWKTWLEKTDDERAQLMLRPEDGM